MTEIKTKRVCGLCGEKPYKKTAYWENINLNKATSRFVCYYCCKQIAEHISDIEKAQIEFNPEEKGA